MSKTTEYIKEVRAEMKHVTWPSRNQTIFYTIAVLVVSVAIAYYLGLFDFLFSKGLEWLLLKH
jgi:preprotein translocase subunit SecE